MTVCAPLFPFPHIFRKKSSAHKFKVESFGEKALFSRYPRHGYHQYPAVPTVAMTMVGERRHVDDSRQPVGRMIFRPMPYDMYTLQPIPLSAMTYPRIKKKAHRHKAHVPNGDVRDLGVYLTDGEMSEFRKLKVSPLQFCNYMTHKLSDHH